MTKKNLPNIPLYIGDWEKDCNVLSLEAEAAWLRIIFKMFTNGKQSAYKIPAKGLQNLWRCSKEQMVEIIEEFQDYNICDVSIDGRFIEFTSRRFKKENEISEIRSEAASKRKRPAKSEQKPNKTKAKEQQNTEIDIENEIESEDEIENEKIDFAKISKISQLEIPDGWNQDQFAFAWNSWLNYKNDQFGFKYKSAQSERIAVMELFRLSDGDLNKAGQIVSNSIANGWKGLFAPGEKSAKKEKAEPIDFSSI